MKLEQLRLELLGSVYALTDREKLKCTQDVYNLKLERIFSHDANYQAEKIGGKWYAVGDDNEVHEISGLQFETVRRLALW